MHFTQRTKERPLQNKYSSFHNFGDFSLGNNIFYPIPKPGLLRGTPIIQGSPEFFKFKNIMTVIGTRIFPVSSMNLIIDNYFIFFQRFLSHLSYFGWSFRNVFEQPLRRNKKGIFLKRDVKLKHWQWKGSKRGKPNFTGEAKPRMKILINKISVSY